MEILYTGLSLLVLNILEYSRRPRISVGVSVDERVKCGLQSEVAAGKAAESRGGIMPYLPCRCAYMTKG